jgi:Ca2+:H+ antiporter
MALINRHWVWFVPLLAWVLLAVGNIWLPLSVAVLFGTVLAAVHHAELVAHRVGEPFGTLILAIAVTVIELGLIITLMLSAGPEGATLARDTVFAAVMIILNGLLEQIFQQTGVSAALATLCALTVLALVLPNFTVSEPGPTFSASQLGFVAVVSLMLYITFVMVQTVRHRDYFLPDAAHVADEDAHAAPPSNRAALTSVGILIISLGAVVLLAKGLSPVIERSVADAGLPRAIVGVIIAGVVLLPESVAAVRAALANRLQTSLNLALGSALATIGLTIPAVSAISLSFDIPVALGLTPKSVVLLFLTLLVSSLSLSTARTTVLQGVIHLVIFAVYLFLTIVP